MFFVKAELFILFSASFSNHPGLAQLLDRTSPAAAHFL